MKKLLLAGLPLLIGFGVEARQLTPEESLSRVQGEFSTRGGTPQLVKTVFSPDDRDFKGVYVFNTGEGFMVLSADDAVTPLLGFGDADMLPGDMPPAMEWWLQRYALQIREASMSDDAPSTRSFGRLGADSTDWEDVKALMTSQWGQEAPYNDMTPLKNNQHTLTGCVATSMSQVMRYHAYPESGKGSHSYSVSGSNYASGTFSCDFSEITFDYDIMRDSYRKEADDASKEAVALLNYAAGVSVSMWYGLTFSGSWSDLVVPALYNYFCYTDLMQKPEEDYYTQRQWEEMLYNQMSQGLPVIYGGTSTYGHSWVIDGYKKADNGNMFHVNWGWDGSYNGFFLITNLLPSSSSAAFNHEIEMALNIAKPDTEIENIDRLPLLLSSGEFNANDISTTTSVTVKLGEKTPSFFRGSVTNLGSSIKNGIKNCNATDINGYAGLLLVDNETGARTTIYESSSRTLEPPSYQNSFSSNVAKSLSFLLPENLPEGTYTVVPVFKPENMEMTRVKFPLNVNNAITMTVAGGEASFISTGLRAMVTAVEVPSSVASGENLELPVMIYNPDSRKAAVNVGLRLIGSDGAVYVVEGENDIEIASKREEEYEISGILPAGIADGEYIIELFNASTGAPLGVAYTLSDLTLTIGEKGSAVETLPVENIDNDAEAVYYDIHGLKVANPTRGTLYIMRKGTEVKKIIF